MIKRLTHQKFYNGAGMKKQRSRQSNPSIILPLDIGITLQVKCFIISV